MTERQGVPWAEPVAPLERVSWPEGKAFAFSIFDDPDSQTFQASQAVYSFLAEEGIFTTKGVWPNPADPLGASDHGETCANPAFVAWLQEIKQAGFEIGYHNATSHTSTRQETQRALDRFREMFEHDPLTMSNHYHCREAIYWGPQRLSGWRRHLYRAWSRGGEGNRWCGHLEGDPCFWGDLCRARIRYVRNFVFGSTNTLRACPYMPYHDPQRPYVNLWYAASEAANITTALAQLAEQRQERLEADGGACILYVHFGHGFHDGTGLNPRFRELIRRLARRPGWFVPVSRLLDFLAEQHPGRSITRQQRARLERRWLWHKLRFGSA